MKQVINYILTRLKDRTSVAAIVGTVASIIGVTLAPELKEAVITTIGSLTTITVILLKEKDQPK